MGRLIFPMIDRDARRQRIFDEDGGVDFADILEVDEQTLAVPRQRPAADGKHGYGGRRGEQQDPRLRLALTCRWSLEDFCKLRARG